MINKAGISENFSKAPPTMKLIMPYPIKPEIIACLLVRNLNPIQLARTPKMENDDKNNCHSPVLFKVAFGIATAKIEVPKILFG